MTGLRLHREFAAALGQENGPVRPVRNQSLTSKPLYGANDGNMRDSKRFRKVRGARLTVSRNQRVDRFNIILRAFLGMLPASLNADWQPFRFR